MSTSQQMAELSLSCAGGAGGPSPAMALALAASFGGERQWADNVAAQTAHGDGAGWIVLNYLPHDGTLFNQWMPGHAPQADGGVPILAIEVPGGAVDQVNWAVVESNYAQAVHHASSELSAPLGAAESALVIDVRRAGVYAQAPATLPGAQWRDPAAVAQWMQQLPPDRDILVYCVYGHEVGRNTAVRLRAHGFNARFLEGGIDAWQAAGLPLEPKGAAS
ncbi:rhodanese-like domain-containing protein [Pseudoduganella sp. LjRoot289]|uniref:rhodanese-like domain-containing protein n=1 Tax=Pseudoduganella sp. LjRoot289 TaxID=3342314 RepID=UPI003ECCC23B